VLMQKRLGILSKHGLKLSDIQTVIATLNPLDGAVDFLNWLRSQTQVIIASDTFEQFAGPLMEKLNWPTLFCHTLVIDERDMIVDYQLRQNDQKTKAVEALKNLNYQTIAMGDSYNDTGMLTAADQGILFRPPENVIEEFPQFPVINEYTELKTFLASKLS